MTYYATEYSLVVLAPCLKITEKVASNIASEASYVYIFIKNTINGKFGEFYKEKKNCHTVLPDGSILIGQKLMKNAQIENV